MPLSTQKEIYREFRAKNHQPDRADPETAKKAFAGIRENLGHDPMADIWNEKLNPTQRRVFWMMAGFPGAEDGEYHRQWKRFTGVQKQTLKRTIANFSRVSARIQEVL